MLLVFPIFPRKLGWYLSLLWGFKQLGVEESILLLKAMGGLLRDSREGLLRR